MPARAWVVALAVLTATAGLTSGCGGNSTAATLQDRLLSVADLPAGWSAAPANPRSVQTNAPCLSSLPANSKGWTYAAAGFVQGTAIPTLCEVLATGPQAQQRWQSLSRALAHCRTATITIAGKKATATIPPLSFPRVASTSAAYAWAFTIAGIRIGTDLVLFQTGKYAGYLTYSDLGPPAIATVQAFAGRGGGEGRDRGDGSGPGRGLDHVRAGADRAHQAGHGRLPHRRKRAAPGPDHRLRRNHGELGPALRRRTRPSLPRRDLRQRRRRPDTGPAGTAHHRRDGQPDQRAHQRARPQPARRPRLVDGQHDRPGPRGAPPRPGAPPGPVRQLPRQRDGDTALRARDRRAHQRRPAAGDGRPVPRRPGRRAEHLPRLDLELSGRPRRPRPAP